MKNQNLAKAKRDLELVPESSLVLSKSHNSVQFYCSSPKTSKVYLSKDDPKLKPLAQKMYAKLVLSNPENEQKIFQSLPEKLKELIKPYSTIPELWLKQPFYKKRITSDTVVYRAENGQLVRSKSELIIANKLFAKGIPFRYEAQHILKNNLYIYPDFTILNIGTGEEIIWEHFGLMDDPQYLNTFFKKINTYTENGYILGKNLICTFESKSNPLNLDTIDLILTTLQ